LSGTYKNGNTKLLWELSEAPRWAAPSVRLRLTGSWCPVCARATRRSSAWLTIQEIQALASKRGGRCLSEHYKSSREKLLWECSKGHKWEALHSGIKRGRWCPSCASDARLSIKDMQSIAEERGDRYLSGAYVNTQTKIQWDCSEGHQWEGTLNKFKSGSWCPKYYNKTRGDFRKLTIEEMGQIVADRDGRCLSEVYINTRTKLPWECSEGRTWEATPSGIKKGAWCPECYVSPLTRLKQDQSE